MNYAPGSSVMPFEGTSKASRVVSVLAQVNDDFSYSENFIDKLFLIFDELGRFSQPNSILVFIQVIILFYQYFITSYLPFLPEIWNFMQLPDKILRYLTYPVDFGLGNVDIFVEGGPSYFLIFFSLLLILYLIIILIYFQINKMFPHYHAFITRFTISFLIPIILSPLCYNIGYSFNLIFSNKLEIDVDSSIINGNQTIIINPNDDIFDAVLSNNRKPLYIASTVFSIIFYLILISICYIDIMFRSSTPYLENTILSMWDGFPFFLCILGTNLTVLFSRMIERLPKWTYYFMIVCCIFYNSFILYQIFYFPMIKKWMNVTFSIFVSSSIMNSLFQVFPISSLYRFIIPFCLFFAFIPLYIFLFRFLRKKINSKSLEEINLSHEKNVFRYLRLCIADKGAEFVLFKWLKPINQIMTTPILCHVSQMISFFPSESQNLTLYISFLSKKNDLSLHQRFLFAQLRRVHILRQSNTSKQLNEDLENISKATNQSISYFQQFLIRTIDDRQDITIDQLSFLSKVNRSTNSLCHEAISRYPNNPRFLHLFSQYIIECQADYKRGISLYHEAQLIERGKRVNIDYAFRSMINIFPSYLYKRILDVKGNNILNRKRSKSGSSMSADSVSNEKNIFSDTDIDSNDKIASAVIENPKLRLSLRRAVTGMNSIGITILTISSIFRFLFSIAICIVIYSFSANFLDDRRINYKNIAQIGRVRKFVDLAFFRMAKLWAMSLNISPTNETVIDSLGPNVTLEQYHNFSNGPNFALFSDSFDSIKAIEELGELLIEIKYESSMNIFDKSTSDFVQMNNISFCNRKRKSIVQSVTSVRYFTLYLLHQAMQATYLPKTYENPADWKDDESICEVILNNHNVINILTDQSTILVNQERELSAAVEDRIILFFSISIPVVFVCYLIPFIAGYVKLNYEFQQIFDVLRLLPIEIYKKASQPIAIFQSEFEQTQVAVTQTEQRSYQKVIIILPSIIGTIVVTCVLIAIFLLIKDANNKFYSIVKWLEIGSGRSPLLIETVTNAIYSNIFGYLGDTDYTSLLYHLELVYNYSQRLLYQHKTLIWGSSESTTCNNFSKRLDSLHFVNTCRINMQSDYFQSNYKCLSVDQQVMTFIKFAKDLYLSLLYAINSNPNSTENSSNQSNYNSVFGEILNGYEMVNLHYLGITHLLPRLEAAQEILDEGINLKIKQLENYSLLISLLYLAFTIILFTINLILIKNLRDEYNIVRILIARLPPLLVVSNQSLVELITGNSNRKIDKKIRPNVYHVRYCSNPMIAFDKQLRIQLVNFSTTKVFGFTKEQLFKASLSTIIRKEDALIIQQKVRQNDEHKIENNKNKTKNENEDSLNQNTDSQFSIDNERKINELTELLNNDDGNLNLNNNNNETNESQDLNEKIDLCKDPFKMIIVGVKDDSTQIILSAILTYLPQPDDCYTLILRDETQIYINEDKIESAKQKTNEIMNQILPRALTQDGSLDENISFSIKQVSVICIKILNFNDSLSHMTSVQTVRNMSILFTHFDMQLINYPNLTKTSVISDSYQAVGGLFDINSIRKVTPGSDENQNQADNNQNENNVNSNINKIQGNDSKVKISNEGSKKSVIINEPQESNNKAKISSESSKKNVIINEPQENNNNNETSNESPQNDASINEIQENNNKAKISNESSKKNVIINEPQENNNKDETSNESPKKNIVINEDNNNNNNKGETSNESPQKEVVNNEAQENNNNAETSNESPKKNIVINEDNNNNNNNNAEEETKSAANNENNASIENDSENNNNQNNSNEGISKEHINHIGSGKSIYNLKSLNKNKNINFANVVLDSIYFAFNCFSVVDFFNSANGTNYVIGIGIIVGGPVTAGTIGKEHIQFELIGGAVKESFLVCNSVEDGAIVITKDALDYIKNSQEAKNNMIFERYKQVNLLRSKKTETFIVRPSESLFPLTQFDDINNNSQKNDEVENENDENINLDSDN